MLVPGLSLGKVMRWIPYNAIFTRGNSNAVDAYTGCLERVAVQQSDTSRSHVSVTPIQLGIKIVRLEPIGLFEGARAGVYSKVCYDLFKGAGVHFATVRCCAFVDTSADAVSGWKSESMIPKWMSCQTYPVTK